MSESDISNSAPTCDVGESQTVNSAGENSNSSNSNGSSSMGQNPLKLRIDPLQLLNCLSILLDSKGAIKSMEEVQRVAGLMGKYSKKLVSKCIYLNILQATPQPLLDEFYRETGWNLIYSWLSEAVASTNYPLAQQILTLLLSSPVDVERLKRNTIPKIAKSISKDCPHAGARQAAELVVQHWKDILISSPFTTALPAPTSDSPLVQPEDDLPSSPTLVLDEGESTPSLDDLGITLLESVTESNIFDLEGADQSPLSSPKRGRGRGRGKTRGSPAKSPAKVRGRGRRVARRAAAIAGRRGRGKPLMTSYADLLCQDIGAGGDVPNGAIEISEDEEDKTEGAKRKRPSPESNQNKEEDENDLFETNEDGGAKNVGRSIPSDSLLTSAQRKRIKSRAVITDDSSDEEEIKTSLRGSETSVNESSLRIKRKKGKETHDIKTTKRLSREGKMKEEEKMRKEKKVNEINKSRDLLKMKLRKAKEYERRHRKNSKDGDQLSKDRGGKDREKSKSSGATHEHHSTKDASTTLDKSKPRTTTFGLAKIPRKSSSDPKTSPKMQGPVSFMDALGSADTSLDFKRPSSVKTKSTGFRNSGLFDEPARPAGTAGKRVPSSPTSSSSSSSSVLSNASRVAKSAPSSSPAGGDRPGGVKLISPKRHTILDDGGFMAAIQAAERKKVVRKRKSSESDSSQNGSGHSVGNKPESGLQKSSKSDPESKVTESPTSSTRTEGKGGSDPVLSPTSVKPTFNFYKETLTDEKPESSKENKTSSAEEKKNDDLDQSLEDKEFREVDDDSEMLPVSNSENSEAEMNGQLEAIPPPKEEYEKVNVIFKHVTDLKSSIAGARPFNRPKKGVRWKVEEKLTEIFYFPMDEMERVNVNTIKFKEMLQQERAKEGAIFARHRSGTTVKGDFGDGFDLDTLDNDTSVELMKYKLYPIHLPIQPTVVPGCKSLEKHTQAKRELETMATFFHPAMLPDTPSEPDPEVVTRSEPVVIPTKDMTGSNSVTDNRHLPWPEPLGNQPEFNFIAGPPPTRLPPHPQGQPPPGGHWVIGNQNTQQMFPPVGASSQVFGPSGIPPPAMGVQRGLFMPQNQGFSVGDGRGMWLGGGPDFAPPIIPNGPPPPMGMGGPPMNMQKPSGGPVNRDFQNFHGPPGGGPMRRGGGRGRGMGGKRPPVRCKHFRNGHCRKGDDCPFLHVA